jgi:alpha-L-rhamnosidase
MILAVLTASTLALNATELKVDYLVEPISVQNAAPFFSFSTDDSTGRGLMSTGYTITVSEMSPTGELAATLWDSGEVTGNVTTFIRYPGDAPALKSNTDYTWTVKVSPGDQTATSTFSTALLSMDDWKGSEWIQTAGLKAAQVSRL